MLTIIFLIAGAVILGFVATFAVRGNSPSGKGKSDPVASREGEQQTEKAPPPRATGLN